MCRTSTDCVRPIISRAPRSTILLVASVNSRFATAFSVMPAMSIILGLYTCHAMYSVIVSSEVHRVERPQLSP